MEEINQLSSLVQTLKTQNEQKQEEIFSLKKIIDEQKRQSVIFQSENQKLNQKINNFKDDISKFERETRSLILRSDKKDQEIHEQKMQKADLNNNIRRSHIELVTSEEKIKNLQAMK